MSMANSKNVYTTSGNGGTWAGAVARMRRSGGTSRAGRRAVLLGMLNATYANTARDGRRAADSRAGTTNGSDRA
jgi:hypothetical protein